MAFLAGLMAKGVGSALMGALGGKMVGGGEGETTGLEGTLNTLNQLKGLSSSSTPQAPGIQQAPEGLQYYNRNFKNKKRRMF